MTAQALGGHIGTVRAVVFHPSGRHLAGGDANGQVTMHELNSADLAAPPALEAHSGPVYDLAFHPDGRHLASTGADGTVRLWRRPTDRDTRLQVLRELQERRSGSPPHEPSSPFAHLDHQLWPDGQDDAQPIFAVTFSPSGKLLACAGGTAIIHIWKTRLLDPYQAEAEAWLSGQGYRQPNTTKLTGHTGPVRTLAFSPDGTTLASAGDDDAIRIWNPVTGRQQHALTGHAAAVNALADSPDEQLLASASSDHTVRLWAIRHISTQ